MVLAEFGWIIYEMFKEILSKYGFEDERFLVMEGRINRLKSIWRLHIDSVNLLKELRSLLEAYSEPSHLRESSK